MAPSRIVLTEVFPRLYDLIAAVKYPTHPEAYFQHFDERLEESEHVRSVYIKVERSLQALDEESWRDLRERAVALTVQRDPTRGWQALFDTLNEAKAFAYLQGLGCSEVRFIKPGRVKRPDLSALLHGQRVLCEVKTINISADEANRRERVNQGEMIVVSVPTTVKIQMLDKVTDTLTRAIAQLDHEDPTRAARRFIFVVLHFDDWVGDYQTEYIAQIDAHLAGNPMLGAELVFCPASNLFERRFEMRSATIVDM